MKEYTVGIRELKKPVTIKNPAAVTDLLGELRNAEVEIPTVLHVMPDLSVRQVETCAVGSMMSVSVEARTIFAHGISQADDRSLILVHNHAFQKKAEPSAGDRDFAHGIKLASQVLGIQVHDSVIVGTKEDYSFMEKGLVFEKATHYKPIVYTHAKLSPASILKPDNEDKVSTPKKALALVGHLTKALSKPATLAVIHLTPDLEPCAIYLYPLENGTHKEEAKRILRDAILSPATKYLVMVSNEPMFHKGVSEVRENAADRLRHIRLGATVLCIPIVDMILVDREEHYSFAEHGKELPRSKSYAMIEDEGMKLKGPPKTRRADLPPYSWTFK
jgi:DNA repair protein RadC